MVLFHILLKVSQLAVDSCISVSLSLIYIVELAQDHIKSFFQAVKMYDLPAFFSCALGAEIGVDQEQRFNRQVLDLEIPDGVIRRNMCYALEVVSAKTIIRIVVMQIRNSSLLLLAAAVFTYVMRCSGSRYESKVNRDPGSVELPCSMHGNIMNASDMSIPSSPNKSISCPSPLITIVRSRSSSPN